VGALRLMIMGATVVIIILLRERSRSMYSGRSVVSE
jgi:hypothetical protein